MDSSEYFSVTHSVPVNIERLPADYPIPTPEQLEQEIPEPFRIASEVAQLEVSAIRPLRGLADSAPELVEFLNLQSRKITMIMGYVLAQQDDPQTRHQSITIGASQLSYLSHEPVPPGTRLRLKVFLTEEAAAVYCYGEVAEITPVEGGQLTQVRYIRLREEDQETLVRASLHVQTQQLKNRAAKRNNPTS